MSDDDTKPRCRSTTRNGIRCKNHATCVNRRCTTHQKQFTRLMIHYTTDGSVPTAASPIHSAPTIVLGGRRLKLRATSP